MFRIGDYSLERTALEACGLALLLCLMSAPRAVAQQRGRTHLIVRQTAPESLTLIKPSDPLFEGTLDTYFPGLSQEAGYQAAIRPFLVLARNDTARTAMAYAITWTAHYSNGSVGLPRQAVFVNRPLMDRAATTYLKPGEIRLIAPMFNVTPEGYRWYHSFGVMYPASHFPPSRRLASVDESVDGVVYGDGTFIGADKTHILQRYVMARFAARDEVLAVLKLVQSSTAPQAMMLSSVAQMLNQQFVWGAKAHQDTLLARYVRARGRSAQDLETLLRNRGLLGLEAFLQNFANRYGGNASPSMFGRVYQKLSDTDPRIFGAIPYGPGNP